MNNVLTIMVIVILLAIGAFEVTDIVIYFHGHFKNKKRGLHSVSKQFMTRLTDVMRDCPMEVVCTRTELIPCAHFEPKRDERILGHHILLDPADKDHMLVLFITNSIEFPYFLADDTDLIDLVNARIHSKGELIWNEYNDDLGEDCEVNDREDDDCCVTAVDGHIEESKDTCNSYERDDDADDLISADSATTILKDKFGFNDDLSNSQ